MKSRRTGEGSAADLNAAIVARMAEHTARRHFGRGNVVAVKAKLGRDDWQGVDFWRVLLVLDPGAADKVSDGSVVNNLVGLNRALQRNGETRRASIEYAVPSDLVGLGW